MALYFIYSSFAPSYICGVIHIVHIVCVWLECVYSHHCIALIANWGDFAPQGTFGNV